jgi:hypothetical protein
VSVVVVGTRLDETYRRAVEAHRTEKFERIVDSGIWRKGNIDLPSSINGEKQEAHREVGSEERVELVKEQIRRDMKVEYWKQETLSSILMR